MSTRVVTDRALAKADLALVARPDRAALLRLGGAGALLIAAGVHVAVGFEHAGSNFGALALAAGATQGAMAVGLMVRPSRGLLVAIAIFQLICIQLYAINVTIGLPPVIAHSHVGGTHPLFGLTLAWPGVVDAQGVLAKGAEGLAAAAALMLRREPAVRPGV